MNCKPVINTILNLLYATNQNKLIKIKFLGIDLKIFRTQGKSFQTNYLMCTNVTF